jgi:hypothetical protein
VSGNTPKIFVAVLLILGVFFMCGVGAGINNGLGAISLEGVINLLNGLFPSPPVRLEDINASPEGCLDRRLGRIEVSPLGQCELAIRAGDANVRSLVLEARQNDALHVELTVSPVEGKAMTLQADLPDESSSQSNRLELDIYRDGGTLRLSQCVPSSGGSCILDLG